MPHLLEVLCCLRRPGRTQIAKFAFGAVNSSHDRLRVQITDCLAQLLQRVR